LKNATSIPLTFLNRAELFTSTYQVCFFASIGYIIFPKDFFRDDMTVGSLLSANVRTNKKFELISFPKRLIICPVTYSASLVILVSLALKMYMMRFRNGRLFFIF
jgi:hypothetical protein